MNLKALHFGRAENECRMDGYLPLLYKCLNIEGFFPTSVKLPALKPETTKQLKPSSTSANKRNR